MKASQKCWEAMSPSGEKTKPVKTRVIRKFGARLETKEGKNGYHNFGGGSNLTSLRKKKSVIAVILPDFVVISPD